MDTRPRRTASNPGPAPPVRECVRLEESRYNCDHCRSPIIDIDRYQCVQCSAATEMNTFDVCASCLGVHAAKAGATPHQLLLQKPVSHVMLLPSSCESIENRFDCWGARTFFAERAGPERTLRSVRYDQVYRAARGLASWILADDATLPTPLHHVAIVAHNCSEWAMVEVATIFAGAVSVGVHTTISLDDTRALLAHAQVRSIVCDERQWTEKFAHLGNSPYRVLVMRSAEWERIINTPEAEWSALRPAQSPDEIRSLMYTSGSTGVPKATIVVDRDRNSDFARMAFWRPPVIFCFQPLAYATQRLIFYDMLCNGGLVVVHSGDMLTFFDELRAARVSSFSAPPQIFNLLYASYKSAVEIGVRQRGEEHRAAIEKAAKLDVLGIFPRARLISTGGATSAQYVLDWMREVVQLGTCTFQEGYGISEVGNVASNGIRAWECKVHIEPVPELGYSFAPDDNPVRGLLWAHSKDLTLGYFGDTEKTNSVFKDIFGDGRRWFNTGDIVFYNKRTEELYPIDRATNFVKLSNSVFVSCERIELICTRAPVVESIWVHAASSLERCLCVVVPSRTLLCHILGASEDSYEQLCASPAALALVQGEIDGVCKEAGLLAYEIPRVVRVESKRWSSEEQTLTVSFKLARHRLRAKYASLLGEAVQPAVLAPVAASASGPNEIEAILTATLQLSPLPWDSRVVDVGVGSSTMMLLAHQLRPLGVTLEALYNQTLRQLVDAAPFARERIDFAQECVLPEEVSALLQAPAAPLRAVVETVLLTGATGFLGAYLLHALVKQGLRVVALVRGDDGVSRLRSAWRMFIGDGEEDTHITRSVEVIEADFGAPLFGLDQAAFVSLAQRVDLVLHNGALVTGVMPYVLMRDANVRSTKTCIHVAALQCRRLIFVSSLSALLGRERAEEPVSTNVAPLGSMSGYGASKRVSEVVVGRAAPSLLVCSIVRPGTIGGSTTNGALSPNDTLARYMIGVCQLQRAPKQPANPVSAAPVDWVAHRIVSLVGAASPFRIVHLFGTSVAFEAADIAEAAQAMGFAVQLVPWAAFCEQLVLSKALSPLLSYFAGASGHFPVGVDSQVADASLESPRVTKADLAVWYRWLASRGFIDVPRTQ